MFHFNEKIPPIMPPKGEFPHEKPRYTMTEEVEHTARQMRETIERLLRFEERVTKEMDDLMRQISSDNVIFKTTMRETWACFIQEVKNEINVFEGNVDATVALFQKDMESNYATLSEDVHLQLENNMKEFTARVEAFEALYNSEFETLKTTLTAQHQAHEEVVNSRLDAFNTNHAQAFADYQQKMTTEINMFEATVNSNIENFQESVGNTIHVFKETWTQIVEQRLNAQDAKLSDAEMYMKTNLVGTVTQAIGDMHASGEFVDIIEGEVFNDMQSAMTHINVRKFGAYCDGSVDATEAIVNAITYATEFGVLLVFEGTFLISDTITFTCNVDAENATFIYAGERNRPAIVVADKDHLTAKFGYIRDTDFAYHGWANDNYIGLLLKNLTHCNVSVRKIENFTVGLETRGQGSGFGWNNVNFKHLRNNRIQHHIVTDSKSAWHNANVFNGGDISWSGNGLFTTADVQRYSIKQSCLNVDGGISCNSNVFNNYYLECADSTIKHTAIEVLFTTYWTFDGTRIEHAFSDTNKFIVVDCSKCVDVATKGSHTHACRMVNTTYYSLNATIEFVNNENVNFYTSIPEIFFVDFMHKFHTVYAKNYADLPIVELKDGFYHIERTTTMKIADANSIADSVVPYFYCPNDSIVANPHRALSTANGTCLAVWLRVESGCTLRVHNSCANGSTMVRCFNANGEIINERKLISCGDYRETNTLYKVSMNEGLKEFSILDNSVAYIAIAFESVGTITIESDNDNVICKWLPPTDDFNGVCLYEQFYSDVKPNNTTLPVGMTVATPSGTYYLNAEKVWTLCE